MYKKLFLKNSHIYINVTVKTLEIYYMQIRKINFEKKAINLLCSNYHTSYSVIKEVLKVTLCKK